MNISSFLLDVALDGFCTSTVLSLLLLAIIFGSYCVYSINVPSAKKQFFISYFCFVFTSLCLFAALFHALKGSREQSYPSAEESIEYDRHHYVHAPDCPCRESQNLIAPAL